MTNGRRRPTRNGLPPRIGRVTISRLSQIYFRPRNRVYVGRGSVIRGCALTILVPLRQRSVLPPRRQRGNNRLDTVRRWGWSEKRRNSPRANVSLLLSLSLLSFFSFCLVENYRLEDYFCLSQWNQEEESALNERILLKISQDRFNETFFTLVLTCSPLLLLTGMCSRSINNHSSHQFEFEKRKNSLQLLAPIFFFLITLASVLNRIENNWRNNCWRKKYD